MHMYLINQSGDIDLLEIQINGDLLGGGGKGKGKEKEKKGFCSSVHMLCTDHVGGKVGGKFSPLFSPINESPPPHFHRLTKIACRAVG